VKRRLREKKRVGELEELGFAVRASLHADVDGIELDAVTRRFIASVESRNLALAVELATHHARRKRLRD